MVIPSIDAKGVYVLKEPLATLLKPGMVLTCIGIRTFGDVVSDGRDPFTTYYQPLELPKEAYEEQAKLGGYIISLITESNQSYHIPAEYIVSAPIPGGVPYEVLGLVAGIGPIAKDKDLTFMEVAVENLIKDKLGIVTDVNFVKLSDTVHMDSTEAQDLENARENAITDKTTDSSKLAAAITRIEELEFENTVLKKHIADNEAQPETPPAGG